MGQWGVGCKRRKVQKEGHCCLKLIAQTYVAIKENSKGKHRNRKRKQKMNLVTKVAHTSYDVYPPLGRRLKDEQKRKKANNLCCGLLSLVFRGGEFPTCCVKIGDAKEETYEGSATSK